LTTLDLLDRLVAFPTISANSNLPLIDFIRGYLTDRGFE
jgi:acetylornithine deacetylase